MLKKSASFCMGIHHFHSLHPRLISPPLQISRYFHSHLQLTLFYSLFQSPSNTRAHHNKTFLSCCPFLLFTFTGAYIQTHTHPCIFHYSYPFPVSLCLPISLETLVHILPFLFSSASHYATFYTFPYFILIPHSTIYHSTIF